MNRKTHVKLDIETAFNWVPGTAPAPDAGTNKARELDPAGDGCRDDIDPHQGAPWLGTRMIVLSIVHVLLGE